MEKIKRGACDVATHNYVRIIGYILKAVNVINEGQEGEEKILFSVCATNRPIEGYRMSPFQEILVFYDTPGEQFEKMRKLKQFDLIDLTGVYNVVPVNKESTCPYCGCPNIRMNGVQCFVYPISLTKRDSLEIVAGINEEKPDEIIRKYHAENSNRVFLMGNVVSVPEWAGKQKTACCRYKLAVERKYYILTQDDRDIDYPFIYSYGKQAENDMRYLKHGALVLVDGFIRNRKAVSTMRCIACGQEYTYPGIATEIVPYSVEYLRGYYSKEEAEEKERLEAEEKADQARSEIFG